MKLAKYSKKILRKPVKLSTEEPFKDKYSVKQKIKFENISLEQKIKKIFEIEKDLIKTKIKLPIRYLEYFDEKREKIFVNSEGSLIQAKIPKMSFDYIIAFISNGSSEQRISQKGGTGGWELLKQWKLKQKTVQK